MTQTKLRFATPPSLLGLLNEHKRDIMNSINCVSLAKVVNFDQKHRTCDVELQFDVMDFFYNPDYNDGENNYPILYQCPVIGEHFQSPIHEGDNCLVFFCDKCIDRWYSDDDKGTPVTARSHSLSDGFVLFEIGNQINSTFIPPEGYEPPHDLPEINDCPIPKYGYEPDYARFRYENGEIDLGLEPTRNSGVTIVARDYSNITMYAEGSDGNDMAGNIMMFPTNSFHFNNGFMNIVYHGDSDYVLDPTNESSGVDNPPIDENGGGKISFYNDKLKKTIGDDPEKPDNWWAGKTVPISDMYRILAQCKACLDLAQEDLTKLGSYHGYTPKLSIDAIMDFKNRYCNLFAPAPPEEGD